MGSCQSSKNDLFFYERAATVAMSHSHVTYNMAPKPVDSLSMSTKTNTNTSINQDMAKCLTHIDTKYKEIDEYNQMRMMNNEINIKPHPSEIAADNKVTNSISIETVKIRSVPKKERESKEITIEPDQDAEITDSHSNGEKFIRSRYIDDEEESKSDIELPLEYVSTDGHRRVRSRLSMDFTNTDIHIDDDGMDSDSPTSPVTMKPSRT